ncbi:MAG: biliverdin-producing heme oxygenase [Deltaproteobacteria bacterium]|nr:biliverdin-producing heme oxygenase [Deltaproteobacteria bacterium]
MRAIQRLDDETRQLHAELEAEHMVLLEATEVSHYQRYLTRAYGFVSPIERSLLDTPGLSDFVDSRRLRKSELIEHDLQTTGLKPLEVQSIPQCMWIPWFDDPHTAIGWAYVVERNTLAFAHLFRHLANVLPGEAAFASSYLKVYAGVSSDMWRSFCDGVDAVGASQRQVDMMVAGAVSAFRNLRRWRNTLDGKNLSNPHNEVVAETSAQPPVVEHLVALAEVASEES